MELMSTALMAPAGELDEIVSIRPIPSSRPERSLRRLDRDGADPPHNLPPQPTRLLGREQEVDAVCALLSDDIRLLTLTGPGGVGKTRLALAASEAALGSFPHGVWFVDLSPLADSTLVLSTIARALGVRDVVADRSRETLVGYLRDRSLLLVLDNIEQVRGAGIAIEGLLAACPSVKVLATSREPLHLRREYLYEVPPLAVPEPDVTPRTALETASLPCVALFLERAHAADATFALTDANAPIIAEICRRLDGLPLAIELAGARVRFLEPAALLARMNHRLSLLRWNASDLPPRQRTLSAALDWSHGLLTAEERTVFRRLGVFVSSFSLESAEAVCRNVPDEVDPTVTEDEPTEQVLDVLASLVEKHLVRAVHGQAGGPRFRLLETVREYALVQLQTSNEVETIRSRHMARYLALAERAEPELVGPDQAAWLDRLEAEYDNLRAAIGWAETTGDAETRLCLASALWRFWLARSHLREGYDHLDAALARSEGVDPTLLLRALEGAGVLALWLREDARAVQWLVQGRALADNTEDLARGAAFRSWLGMAAHALGDRSRAWALMEEARELALRGGDRRALSLALRILMVQSLRVPSPARDGARLRADTEEAARVLREFGDQRNLSIVLAGLARLQADANETGAGETLLESLRLADQVNDQLATAFTAWHALLITSHRLPLESTARLLGVVEALAARMDGTFGFSLDASFTGAHDHESIRKIADGTRRALSESVFAASTSAGRAVPFERVPGEVLSLVAEFAVTPAVIHRSHGNSAQAECDVISPREREVLTLVAEGHSNKKIAEELFIAPTTAKFHVTSLLNKLGADTRAQLVAIAAQQGML